MKRLYVFILAAIAALVLTACPLPAENEMFTRINLQREQHGLPPLPWSDCVAKNAARPHAQEMAANKKIYHSDDGLIYRVDPCYGGRAGQVWENVGVTCAGNYDTLTEAFMNSPTHRSVILWPEAESVGIGVVTGEDGCTYVAMVFGKR